MEFEWDAEKAAANLVAHGVSFDVARTAFADPFAHTMPDPIHSTDENRFVLMGRTNTNHLVVVVYTDREETTRLIQC